MLFACLALAQSFTVFDLQSLSFDGDYLVTESDYDVSFSLVPGGDGLIASLDGEIDMLYCPTCTKYTSENPTLYKQIAFDFDDVQSVEIPLIGETNYEEGSEFEAESALVTVSDEVYSELFLTREYDDICKVFVPGSYEGKIIVEPETEGEYLSISFYDGNNNPALVPVFTHACNSEDTNGPYFVFSVSGMNWEQVNDMGAVFFEPDDSTWVFQAEADGGYDFGLNGQSIELEQFVKHGSIIQDFSIGEPLSYSEKARSEFAFKLYRYADVQISVERLVVSEEGLNAVGAYDEFVHQLDDADYKVAPAITDEAESYDDSGEGYLYYKSGVLQASYLYWDLEESSFGPYKGVPPGIYKVTLEAFSGDEYDSETVILPLEWLKIADWPSVYQYALPDEFYEKDTVSGNIYYDSVPDGEVQRFSLTIEQDGAEFTHAYGTTGGSVGSLPAEDEAFEFSWARQLNYGNELDAIQDDLNFAVLTKDYLNERLNLNPSDEELELLEAQLDEVDLLIIALEGQLDVIDGLAVSNLQLDEEFTAVFARPDFTGFAGLAAASEVFTSIGLGCLIEECFTNEWTITIKNGGLEGGVEPEPAEGLSDSCGEFLVGSHALGLQQGGWVNCEDCEGYSVYVTGVDPLNPNTKFTVDGTDYPARFYGSDGRDWGLQYANSFELGKKYWMTVFDEEGNECDSSEYVTYHAPFCEYTRDGDLQYLISLPYPVNNINKFKLTYGITVNNEKTIESAVASIKDEGEILGHSAWQKTVFYGGSIDAVNLLGIGMFGEYYDEDSFYLTFDLVRSDNPYQIECSKVGSLRGVDLSLEVEENDYDSPGLGVMTPVGADLTRSQMLQYALSNLQTITQLRPVDLSSPLSFDPILERPAIGIQTPFDSFVAEVDEQGQVSVEEVEQIPSDEVDVTVFMDDEAIAGIEHEFGITALEIQTAPLEIGAQQYFSNYLTAPAYVPVQGTSYSIEGLSVERARGLLAHVQNELAGQTFKLNDIPSSSFLVLMRMFRVREGDVIAFLLSEQSLNQYYSSGDVLAELLTEQILPSLGSEYSREELARMFIALKEKNYHFSNLDNFNRLWGINQQGAELSGEAERIALFEGKETPITIYLDNTDESALFHNLFLNLSRKVHMLVEWHDPESPTDFIVKIISWPFGGKRPDVKGAKGYGSFKAAGSCFHKDSVIGKDELEKSSFLHSLKARLELQKEDWLDSCSACVYACSSRVNSGEVYDLYRSAVDVRNAGPSTYYTQDHFVSLCESFYTFDPDCACELGGEC